VLSAATSRILVPSLSYQLLKPSLLCRIFANWEPYRQPYLALTSISPRHALGAKMMHSAFQVVVSQLSLYSTSGMKVTVIHFMSM